jgi:hypothetical protein
LIGLLSHRTSLMVAFWLVMGTLFYLVAFACSPLAARLIRWLRTREYPT